jgi:threonine dehydrogenase-like Zn-dependent dehydrogenase
MSAAKEIRAERVIAVGHNETRLIMARQFGATDTFDSHNTGVQDQILELTKGGAPHVVEAVGNQESMELAINVARAAGTVSFVGVPHNVKTLPIASMFRKHVTLHGGPAPVRAYLPRLIESVAAGRIDPLPVFDLELPLARVAEGYAAMDERRAIKVLLDVS